MASLALLGFVLSACSDLATQPERSADVGAVALGKGALPGAQPDGQVVGAAADECSEVRDGQTECPPLDVKPPTDNCAENPFGENCGWNGGGGDPPEPPREGEPGGGGSPGGGDPTPPQDNCAEGEECEEGIRAYLACVAAGTALANEFFNISLKEQTLALSVDKYNAAKRWVEYYEIEMMNAIERGESGLPELHSLRLAEEEAEFAKREMEIAEKELTQGRIGLAVALAGVIAGCTPLLGVPGA